MMFCQVGMCFRSIQTLLIKKRGEKKPKQLIPNHKQKFCCATVTFC